MKFEFLHGEAESILPALPEASCDALITDPPGGRSFMKQAWDSDRGGRTEFVSWLAAVLRLASRCLVPGAFCLVWGGRTTFHWTTTAVEDAGFEIVDNVGRLFAGGGGMPKARGALRPGIELWCLGRKPGPTRPLNIDACRVPREAGDRFEYGVDGDEKSKRSRNCYYIEDRGPYVPHPAGRYPSNVVLDDGAVELLGGKARFFYAARASVAERGDENDHPTVKSLSFMQWACRLLCLAPGSVVLDPFAGTGSTGIAANLEGHHFVGIEQERKWIDVAWRRRERIVGAADV